jgi:DNA modification methylase
MMMMMMMKAGWQVKHELIWRKQSLVLNRADYNYQHEPILFGWNKSHRFYGKGKYHNTSVWEYDRPTKSKEHPTMKPIALLGEILMNSSADGDSVIDLFGGSGSTLIACEQLKRKCYMMELDPHYVDVIIARWEQFTGKEAVLLNG